MTELMGYNSSAGQRGKGHAALADLTRTLEALEDRLDRVSRTRSAPAEQARYAIPPLSNRNPARNATQGRTGGRRPELSDAVSQIVMRQKLLDKRPQRQSAPAAPALSDRRQPRRENAQPLYTPGTHADRRAPRQANASVNDLKSELHRLRDELTRNLSSDVSRQVEDMREALADLQSAIVQNARPAIVRNEIVRLHERLDQMGRSGVDPSLVADMRAQLDDIDDYLDRRSVSGPGASRFSGGALHRAEAEKSANERAELKAEIERLRDSLSSLASEDHLRAVEQRWTDFEERFVSEVGARDRTSEITDKMMAEIANLRTQMKEFASDHSIRAAESLWNGVEQRFTPREETEETFERIGERIGHLEATLTALPEALPFDGIDRRIEALAGQIEAISAQMASGSDDYDRFSNIDARLDDITQAITTLATNPPEFDLAPIERIEDRMQALAERVESIASDGSVAMLSEQLSELSGRFDTFGQAGALEPNDHLAAQIGRMNARLDEMAEQNGVSHADMAAIETRLSSLAERIETQLATPFDDGEAIANLENQVGRLTDFLNSDTFTVSAEMERRLGDLEKRVEENAEQIFIAAKSAADEAVRQMLEHGDLRQGEHVSKLTEELERLEKLSNDSSVRSTDFYEAVNSALSRLVDRIDAIEHDIGDDDRSADKVGPVAAVGASTSAATSAAGPLAEPRAEERWSEPASEDLTAAAPESPSGLRALLNRSFKKRADDSAPTGNAAELDSRWTEDQNEADERKSQDEDDASGDMPSLDAADALESDEANRPLEIGSGGPDIAALLERVRNQKAAVKETGDDNAKADFIAAARRAAMAAAEEAEGFNSDSASERGGVADAVSRRRKPIMLAASAVLLALLALPVGKVIAEKTNLFSGDAPITTAAGPSAETNDAPIERANTVGTAESAPVIGISEEPKKQIAASRPDASQTKTGSSAATSPVSKAAFSPEQPAQQVGPTVAASQQSFETEVAALPEGLGSQPLLEAAASGDAKALFEIGLRLMEGRTVSSDPAKAAEWFERSANLSFAPAQYSLGTLYEKGNGVERNTIAARDWYLKAANAGNVRAMHNLAVLFATGVDGKSEPDLAADWFVNAAEHGMTDSQYNLGILYARGAGVDQDLTKSYKWFAVVGESGDKDALEKRDEIAKSLSPEALAEAKQAVANFKVKDRSEAANTVDIPKEWAAAASAEPTTTASIDMSRAIRNIQAILGKLGYDAGTPDGLVGTRTTDAIKAFQTDAGLAATGEIDETLIRALLDRKNG